MGRYAFVGEAHSVGAARREVAAALRVANVQSSGVAELLTSELVANAVEHAGTDFEVVVEINDLGVRIEIHDGAAVEEALRDPISTPQDPVDPSSLRRRGLFLVGSTAVRFGLIDKGCDGKAVWFELHRHDA